MLGIIGGTGVYQIEALEVLEEIQLETPFGTPSDKIVKAQYQDQTVFFLPRHGRNHALLPHEINYRANIYALKSLGVTQVIGISAVGSLRQELAPGDFVLPSQYIDFIKGNRERTFFGNGIAAHVSTAKPTSVALMQAIEKAAKEQGHQIHADKTYVAVDGPRLGTQAESFFLRDAMKADIVGMTNVPEVFLAREAQICYATIGIVTDYDCWMEDPAMHASVEVIIARYGESITRVKDLVLELLRSPLPEAEEDIRHATRYAVLTPKEIWSEEQAAYLEVLLA